MKYVHSHKDVPSGEHYVILETGSVFIPGDERSRTHPGHGYPERTQTFPEMRVYTSKEEWLEDIQKEIESNPTGEHFIAYHVDAIALVKTRVEVNI